MKRSPLLSCIITTRDKIELIYEFLRVIDVEINKDLVQVIIVLQGDLEPNFESFKYLDLVTIKTGHLSLSQARNKGLVYACGKYLSFPDDDCVYDTLLINKLNYLDQVYKETSFVGGLYIDGCRQHDFSIANYKDLKALKKIDYIDQITSVTMFINKEFMCPFDEEFGLGGTYPSCEEFILTQHLIDQNHPIRKSRELKVFHTYTHYSDGRIIKSSYGHGAFIAQSVKNYGLFNPITFCAIWSLFLRNIFAIFLLKFGRIGIYKRWLFLKYRVLGFYHYVKNI